MPEIYSPIGSEFPPSMAYMEKEAAANAETGAGARRVILTEGSRARAMGRIIILLFFLVLLGGIGLVGYAYSGFLQPEVRSVSEPVALDVD